MILPPRIPKKAKRSSRWRSQAHCNFVRSHACSVCHETAGVQVAHVRLGSGTGMGQKPDDWRAVSLCAHHHTFQHSVGEATFWGNYRRDCGLEVEAVIEAFCKASPKAAEIRAVRKEREGG